MKKLSKKFLASLLLGLIIISNFDNVFATFPTQSAFKPAPREMYEISTGNAHTENELKDLIHAAIQKAETTQTAHTVPTSPQLPTPSVPTVDAAPKKTLKEINCKYKVSNIHDHNCQLCFLLYLYATTLPNPGNLSIEFDLGRKYKFNRFNRFNKAFSVLLLKRIVYNDIYNSNITIYDGKTILDNANTNTYKTKRADVRQNLASNFIINLINHYTDYVCRTSTYKESDQKNEAAFKTLASAKPRNSFDSSYKKQQIKDIGEKIYTAIQKNQSDILSRIISIDGNYIIDLANRPI